MLQQVDLIAARERGYEIQCLLGVGAMCNVYAAVDQRGRRVALKCLHEEWNSARYRQALRREGAVVASLSHPNIYRNLDNFELYERSYVVFEQLAGCSLHHKLRAGRLSIPLALTITAQLLEALDVVHAHGHVHRDIKTNNIFWNETDDHAYLIDFGLATSVLTANESTLCGTVLYMSPEQTRTSSVDARSDLFSLGTCLYEMITGHLPFDDKDEPYHITIQKIRSDPPTPLSKYLQEVDSGLERVVRKLLEKDVAQRYQNAAEAWVDVVELQASCTGGARA